MRAMIGRRQVGEQTPVARARSTIFEAPRPSQQPSNSHSDDLSRKLEGLISDADKNMGSALSHQEALHDELKALTTQFKQVSTILLL